LNKTLDNIKMDVEEDHRESETEEELEVPKRRGRPVGAKNKPKEAPPPTPADVYSALQDRIAFLEASRALAIAKKVTMKPPKKKEPIRLVGSPTNAAKQLCEILRRDGVLPPAREPEPPYVRESARQKREALYASFLP
jgi:hypothetical protein